MCHGTKTGHVVRALGPLITRLYIYYICIRVFEMGNLAEWLWR